MKLEEGLVIFFGLWHLIIYWIRNLCRRLNLLSAQKMEMVYGMYIKHFQRCEFLHRMFQEKNS
jgi:hypothetical protein